MSDSDVTLKKELLDLYNDPFFGKNLLLWKGEEEYAAFKEWLGRKEPVPVLSSSIEDAIRNCNRCPDIRDRKVGYGTGENGVMIVLNAPRYLTPSRRELYRNESVELLKKMVSAINLDIRHCYVTNLVKCETGEVAFKPSEMVANCQPILLRELEELSPGVVLVLGEIMPLQTIIHESTGIEWFNVEHPITLINNPEHKRQAWETLKLMKRSLKG